MVLYHLHTRLPTLCKRDLVPLPTLILIIFCVISYLHSFSDKLYPTWWWPQQQWPKHVVGKLYTPDNIVVLYLLYPNRIITLGFSVWILRVWIFHARKKQTTWTYTNSGNIRVYHSAVLLTVSSQDCQRYWVLQLDSQIWYCCVTNITFLAAALNLDTGQHCVHESWSRLLKQISDVHIKKDFDYRSATDINMEASDGNRPYDVYNTVTFCACPIILVIVGDGKHMVCLHCVCSLMTLCGFLWLYGCVCVFVCCMYVCPWM